MSAAGPIRVHPARRDSPEPRHSDAVLTITQAELERAVPLAPGDSSYVRRIRVRAAARFRRRCRPAPGWNGLAIASFICALAGIPLFGIITGLVAVVLAVIALGAIRASSQRGLGLAIAGLLARPGGRGGLDRTHCDGCCPGF